jgi:peptide/nickel transport system substrate-binding protein
MNPHGGPTAPAIGRGRFAPGGRAMSFTFRILGPLEVLDGDRVVALGGLRQRALLAMLVLRANEVVATDRLIDELWGESPPPTARQTVQVYVSQLRRALRADGAPDGAIETRTPGYLLHIGAGRLDLDRFEALFAAGRDALAAGDPGTAAATLREALALWRGPPLADFAYERFAQRSISLLEERRLACIEERIEADLQLARHADLVGELQALVGQYPLRESLRGQLMVALNGSGRQAEALECYAAGRRVLIDELGIEPGTALRDLEMRILHQDPALIPIRGTARRLATSVRRTSRARAFIAGAALLAVAGLGVWLAGRGGDGAGPAIPGDSLIEIDARSGRATAPVELHGSPSQIALAAGAVWVGDVSSGGLERVDPHQGTVVQTIAVGNGANAVAAGGGSVWVASALDGTLLRVSPETNTVVQSITVPTGPRGVAFGDAAVWVASRYARTITRIDPRSGRVAWTARVGGSPIGIAVGAGAVWTTNETDASVSRVDPHTGRVQQRIGVGNSPGPVQVGDGAVWVANTLDGTVSRIDPATNAVAATIPVGEGPAGLAVGEEGVWVANELGGTLMRIDPRTNAVVETIQTGQRPTGVALEGGRLWVASRDASAAHRGGTLRVAMPYVDSVDQFGYSSVAWLDLTGDGLIAYRRAPGADGASIVPDLAASIPTPTDDGLTYTFALRRGVRYSTGETVRPADIRRAIERFFRLGSPESPDYYRRIVGAPACRRRPAACDLSRGIVADPGANTVTIHLSRPDPNLLYLLALPFANAVAPSAPRDEASGRGLPATGPYLVADHRPGREVRLVRNPYFHVWSGAARPDGYPDEILLTQMDDRRAVAAVEHNRLDTALSGRLKPAELERLALRYPGRLRVAPLLGTFLVALNTTRAPFDRLEARRAVAYALDRGALVRIGGGSRYAQPTCQVLPPSFPAYQPYCPYTLEPTPAGIWHGPDLDKGRRLVARSGTAGAGVTVWTWPPFAREARYVAGTLRRLGYRATAHVASENRWGAVAYGHAAGSQLQVGVTGWGIDYPAPSTFFEQFRCGAADPARFCDRVIDRWIDRALALQTTDPAAADELWARIDRALTDQAAWVAYATPREVRFLSSRVGNFQFHPVWGVELDQLWVR